ncbi:hypothetical protein [Frankia sp. AgW1.1]|uniref:hypothetical protein n=1 Tax=Frankia sp. AgW1.1 TaxID=1836971 RepID=UPI0019348814|nr:hypothetical protein [Frankia sp. AgW1.1]MBL7487057.1 hypothetical protein [Frankia sp. AgW1.1]
MKATEAARPRYPVDLSVTVTRRQEPSEYTLRLMTRSLANSRPPEWPEFVSAPVAPWRAPEGERIAHVGAWAIFLFVFSVATLPVFLVLLALWAVGHSALAASHSWKHLFAVLASTAITGVGAWFALVHFVAPHLH